MLKTSLATALTALCSAAFAQPPPGITPEMFVGDDCGLCTNPTWDVASKGFGK